jgi:hypothetical protein
MPRPQVQALLDIMRKMESNDGKYTDHALLSDGTHAVGDYGIKPVTAQDMLKRSPANVNDKSLLEVQGMLEDSPEMQQKVAEMLAEKVLKNNQGQLDPSAAAWHKGQNRSMNKNEQYLQDTPSEQDRLDKAKAELGIMPTLYNKLKEPR